MSLHRVLHALHAQLQAFCKIHHINYYKHPHIVYYMQITTKITSTLHENTAVHYICNYIAHDMYITWCITWFYMLNFSLTLHITCVIT